MQISPISYPCLLEKQAGHTLIELLVALTVSSILLASATPMFAGMLMNNRATTLANNLLTSLQVARFEAIKRNRDITICKSNDAVSCSGSWSDGWIIFSDFNKNKQLDTSDGDQIIEVKTLSNAEFSINWNAFRSDTYIRYNALGFIHSNNGTFKLCPPNSDARYARAIIINRLGRARVSRDADQDGIHEDSRGRALSC